MKFVGKDGSMGLEYGRIYNVSIHTNRQYIVVRWNKGPKRPYEPQSCPYDSLKAVLRNWKEV